MEVSAAVGFAGGEGQGGGGGAACNLRDWLLDRSNGLLWRRGSFDLDLGQVGERRGQWGRVDLSRLYRGVR